MKIKIISWNVNGIRAATKKGLINYIEKENADIYCFQEVKARKAQIETPLPSKYLDFWNSAERAGYSGTLTLSKDEPKMVIIGDRDNDWDNEGRVIVSKFDEFTLLNVYFPNGQRDKGRLNYKMEFYEQFLKYINELRERGEKVIFCGDVNTAHNEIDLARPKDNQKTSGFLPIEREWVDKLESDGWVDTYRELNKDEVEYSWWSQRAGARKRNVGWRIDYFFVDKAMMGQVKSAFIRSEIEGSDHAPVGIEIEL